MDSMSGGGASSARKEGKAQRKAIATASRKEDLNIAESKSRLAKRTARKSKTSKASLIGQGSSLGGAH